MGIARKVLLPINCLEYTFDLVSNAFRKSILKQSCLVINCVLVVLVNAQAARSEIFKNMLDSDAYKAPASDTIMLPELNHQELESLLEFLYSGNLPSEKLEKHVYSLTLAADKYDIPYLLKFCERHMLRFLNSSNALDVLEISDTCSNKTLKETALNFIVKNMEDVVFSTKYEAFVPENPHLAVQITRALLMDVKNRRNSGV
jgi:speckle-type POZ protein